MINNFLLDVLAAGAILSGILVITSKNPVIAVLFLISAFCNAAGYLMLLGVGFVGISYIIVYIGAIAVLFLFVIMMININLSDILDIGSQYTKNLPLALTVGFLFTYEIFTVIPVNFGKVSILNLPIELLTYLNGLLYGSTVPSISDVNISPNPHTWDISSFSFLQVESLGHGLYTYGAPLFILCSIILLLAMLAPISVVHFKPSNNQKPYKTSNPSRNSISFNRTRSVKHNLGLRASYHTSSHSGKLDPWAVTGLVDAEGYFGFTITKKSGRKLAFELKPQFCLHMHAREYDLLVSLKEFFGVGTVTLRSKDAYYTVYSKRDLEIIVQHSNSLYDRIKLTLYSALESCCSCRARAAPSLDGAIYGRQLF
jgi:NADH-ubiquinone oxidoreductase chain 6